MQRHHFKVTGATDVGDPADRIIKFVTDNNIDVVVMSTHGRTGLKRWFMGSVAQKVLHHASCPVLIVRDEANAK
ncbi:MAG: universal stress protein [Caldilineaceae bacterium]|nr:universal stress protein [Caldilineaceae bacterium]